MDEVVIIGAGMMTAVGLSAAETAASVRAGTTRVVETRLRDKQFHPFLIAEVLDDLLPPVVDEITERVPLSAREARLLRLAARPLHAAAEVLRKHGTQIGLALSLPETETTRAVDGALFLRCLATQSHQAFDPDRSDATHRGRAGGIVALGQAVLTIQSGRADFMLAGGVDSYRDPYVLGTLDRDERIKSAANLDGFIPGEGAGFLLLARASAATALGIPPLACISSVALGFEEGHLFSSAPYRGDGLAATVSALIAQLPSREPIGEVYSSMNGESHWAKEWGVAYIRNRPAFQDSYRMHHPADSCGDTGAAAGPLMAGIAALGVAGQYRNSPALVYGSSDRGARAAIVVSR
jgi:3-oxoacyl-[acyl-carrier-protein] synthase-1